MEFLTFHVGEREFAVDMSRVQEIVAPPPISRVPDMPPALLGLAGLRGEPTAVIDAGLRLDARRIVVTGRTPLLVLDVRQGDQAFRVGLLVEAAGRKLELSELLPWTEGLARFAGADACTGFADVDGKMVIVLDVDQLLDFRRVRSALPSAPPAPARPPTPALPSSVEGSALPPIAASARSLAAGGGSLLADGGTALPQSVEPPAPPADSRALRALRTAQPRAAARAVALSERARPTREAVHAPVVHSPVPAAARVQVAPVHSPPSAAASGHFEPAAAVPAPPVQAGTRHPPPPSASPSAIAPPETPPPV
ncbi:MAG TPA: chemotaxis protein CheW, partial [Anaeromyxobacteraceae bacterium]|nr:chemotaxis protein CheW [Anaeromyxobacteraceae bacterium]